MSVRSIFVHLFVFAFPRITLYLIYLLWLIVEFSRRSLCASKTRVWIQYVYKRTNEQLITRWWDEILEIVTVMKRVCFFTSLFTAVSFGVFNKFCLVWTVGSLCFYLTANLFWGGPIYDMLTTHYGSFFSICECENRRQLTWNSMIFDWWCTEITGMHHLCQWEINSSFFPKVKSSYVLGLFRRLDFFTVLWTVSA